MSSRSGPIRAMVRPRSLPSNDTSTSSSYAATVSSVTSSRPPLSKHSRHCSLESLASSLSHRHTVNNGRAGTVFSSTSHHQRQQQQRIVKSASTGHLAYHTSSHSVSSPTTNTSQCLKDFCPPLNAARLRPIMKCVLNFWNLLESLIGNQSWVKWWRYHQMEWM